MLKLALTNAELYPDDEQPPLTGETLAKVANEYLLSEAVIERMSHLIDSKVLHSLLGHPDLDIDLSNEFNAKNSADRLLSRITDVKIAAEYDDIAENYRLRITRMMHGNVHTSYIDQEFLLSGDYDQIKKSAQVFNGLLSTKAWVKRGERSQPVNDFKRVLEWLFEEAKKGIAIQRYKGLGEMNPDQLWETTMDPNNRRLLRTQIEDTIITDEIFTTLMGDVVEPRREFIKNNALKAKNIDV